jgi:Sulfatase
VEVAGNQTTRRRGRQELALLAELSGLCGLAIALPALDVLGRAPDFLFLNRLGVADLVVLALAIAILPPLALWGLGIVAGLLGTTTRRVVHVVCVAGLLVALALQTGKHLGGTRGLALAGMAVVAGLAATLVYLKWDAVRAFLRILSPAPLLAVALFLFVSPASVLVLPQSGTPAAAAAAGTGAGKGQHPPIIVLALDEFPLTSLLDTSGRVDPANYPNFAWLAERSSWYRNATGITTWTRDAYPAMLTGKYPERALASHYRNYPNNLFTLLDGTYQLNSHEVSTVLCPPHRCRKTGAVQQNGGTWRALVRSGRLVEEIVSPWDQAQEPTAEFEQPVVKTAGTLPPAGFPEFLNDLQPSPTPRLDYVHVLLPHRPWKYLPSGVRYPETQRRLGFTSPKLEGGWPANGQVWTRLALERHRLQLAYADRLLGQTLQTLKQRGLFDKSLLVVTADHGISFAPGTHPRIMLKRTASQVMWVPLFIKAPGQERGKVDDRNYEHVDLLPTLADYAGVKLPWEVDGRSVLAPPRTTNTKVWYTGVREDGPPEVITVDGDAGLAAALRGSLPVRKGAHAELGGEPGRYFGGVGKRDDLIGQQLSGLSVLPGNGSVAVKNLEEFSNVDPASGEVPALVVGEPPAGVGAGSLLALALNGRIGSVAEVAPEGKDQDLRFAGILPGQLFKTGTNELQVLLIERGQLRRLPTVDY